MKWLESAAGYHSSNVFQGLPLSTIHFPCQQFTEFLSMGLSGEMLCKIKEGKQGQARLDLKPL